MDPKEKHSPTFLRFGLPIMRVLGWLFMTVFGPLRRIGAYRVPRTGGVLVLSNHQADIDPIVVQLGCRRPIYFMAKSELFEMKGVRYFLKLFRAFSVKRGEPDKGAIKHAVELLKGGEVVCVYPEGELSETGELLPLKPGIALIVRMAQVPVICCAIDGSRLILPYGRLIPRPAFRRVTIAWGEPRAFAKDEKTETILDWAEGQFQGLLGY